MTAPSRYAPQDCALCGLSFRGGAARWTHQAVPHTARCPECGAACKPASNGSHCDINAHLEQVHGMRPNRGTLMLDLNARIAHIVAQIEDETRRKKPYKERVQRRRMALVRMLHARARGAR